MEQCKQNKLPNKITPSKRSVLFCSLSCTIIFYRDISLTDFEGSFLVIFFSSSVYENGEDLKVINHNVRQLKKHFCDILACSTDSTMLHSKWIQSLKEDDELKSEEFILPLMSDRTGQLW